MRKLISRIRTLGCVALLLACSDSYAVPTLGFGGNLQYDTMGVFPADLNITGNLNGSADLSITPDLGTGAFSLFADFLFETFVPNSGSVLGTTTGTFGTTPVLPDMLITDNGGSGGALRTLLTGNVNTLNLTGPNGFNVGSMDGTIAIAGGDLAGDFGGTGALVAFSFNLSTVFGQGMFNNNFVGIVNGSITKAPTPPTTVPEPVPLALLSIGLIGITLTRRVFKRT